MIRKASKKNNLVVEGKVGRRSLLKRGVFLGTLGTLASAFSLTPMVSEAKTVSSQEKWAINPLQGVQAEKYMHIMQNSQDYKDFLNLAQSQGAPALREGQHSVNICSNGKLEIIQVSSSVVKGDERSVYTVLFESGSSTPIKTTGLLFVLVPGQRNIATTGVVNGKEILHVTYTPNLETIKGDIIAADGRRVTLDGLKSPQQAFEKLNATRSSSRCCDWCCMWNCFNTQGNIPPGILYTAGLLCAAACLVPPACVVCLLGLATISGLAIQQCSYNCCF